METTDVSGLVNHPWDLSAREARFLQAELATRIVLEDRIGSVQRVAGVDVGFEQKGSITRAAIAVLSFPELEVIDQSVVRQPTCFPYVPGLLSFRELPAVLVAWEALQTKPDLLLCDGQGIAHPRRLGIASHLGLWIDRPTIGVAKKRLVGTFEEPGIEKGYWTPLMDKEETIGAVLRSRTGVKPLYISPGHRISLPTALKFVQACLTRYRLPETTRQAHNLASH